MEGVQVLTIPLTTAGDDPTSPWANVTKLHLVVTSRHPIAGRVPEGMDRGNTMVKLSVV